jgi:hypothetical protein
MNCPACDTEMESGFFQVKGNFASFMLFGLSMQDLVFQPNNLSSVQNREVMLSRTRHVGWFCNKCKTSVISNTDEYDIARGKKL